MNNSIKTISVLLIAGLVSFKLHAKPSNIDCIAIYSGLTIAFEKKGQFGVAKTLKKASKKRADRAALNLGREQARQQVISSKYMKQRYADETFKLEAKKCMVEDGF